MKNSFTKIPGNDDFTLMAREVLNTAMEVILKLKKIRNVKY